MSTTNPTILSVMFTNFVIPNWGIKKIYFTQLISPKIFFRSINITLQLKKCPTDPQNCSVKSPFYTSTLFLQVPEISIVIPIFAAGLFKCLGQFPSCDGTRCLPKCQQLGCCTVDPPVSRTPHVPGADIYIYIFGGKQLVFSVLGVFLGGSDEMEILEVQYLMEFDV